MPRRYLTSESVTEGHVDKICDLVSDSVLDDILSKDKNARVDCETFITQSHVLLTGQITTSAQFDVKAIARQVIKDVGYNDARTGLDWKSCAVWDAIEKQSPELGEAVSRESGAGDSGVVFGYATNETPELMPLPIVLAHRITRGLDDARKSRELPFLRPDGKAQVTVEYDSDGRPRINNVVVAAQHDNTVTIERVQQQVRRAIFEPAIFTPLFDVDTKVYINVKRRFEIGGSMADTGLTGRKTAVDAYGGYGSHGGGCFCIVGDALVNTSQGLQKLENIRNLELNKLTVKTDEGISKIGGWYDNGIMDTRKIVTQQGYELEGSTNQLVRIIDANGNYVWKRLDQIAVGDFVAIQRNQGMFAAKFKIPEFKFTHKNGTTRQNQFQFPSELTDDWAYLMGSLIGDGDGICDAGVKICVCEPEQVKNIQNLYQRLFGSKGDIFGHWACVFGVELISFLRHLGVKKARSWNKVVPYSIFGAPKSIVAAFLSGIFDTDGSISFAGRKKALPQIGLGSTSLDLIKGVQALLLNFGIMASISRVPNSVGRESKIGQHIIQSKHQAYLLRIVGAGGHQIFRDEIGFRLPRKQKKLGSVKLYVAEREIIPNQRERVKRLWAKLTPSQHQQDVVLIRRLTNSISNAKATKNLTYGKLRAFLSVYSDSLEADSDFKYLEFLQKLGHYYSPVESITASRKHVYDISVPESQTFIANGYVCHNSGKDPTKIDRSGSYMARYIAKNVVAAGLSHQCEVQIAYALGVAEPVSFQVTSESGPYTDENITKVVRQVFDLRPSAIITQLDLLRPIYRKTACYGHFGRSEPEFTWEQTDKVEALKTAMFKYDDIRTSI